jgi:murein DD-endopeptidase MepM/ murein hydrolase activator NlpD
MIRKRLTFVLIAFFANAIFATAAFALLNTSSVSAQQPIGLPGDETSTVPTGGEAYPADVQQLEALVKAQLAPSVQARDGRMVRPDEILTSGYRFDASGTTAFGISVVRAPEGVHGSPDLQLFMARKDASGQWQIAMEYTDLFYQWVSLAPEAVIPTGEKQSLVNTGISFAQRSSDPRGAGNEVRLSLPWKIGTDWILIGGPHGNNGDSARPWTALDFNPDLGNTSEKILAAREGYVYLVNNCANYIRLDHADGWNTGYYHVRDIQVHSGQYVETGTFLGYTSAQTGCGGWATGPHVHFTLKRYNEYKNIDGTDMGGWRVSEANVAYGGCMTRLRDNLKRCKPTGVIHNEGAVGSGYVDARYDYTQDSVPDLWVVDQRDANVNATSLRIAAGDNFKSFAINTGTGMPQQPATLNTSFASGDYNGDGVPDLWVIHRWDSAGNTAFRVMNGKNLDYLLADEITALPLYDNSVSFAVADYNRDGKPDLWAINPRDSATGTLSVRIVDGSNPATVLKYSGSSMPPQSATADLNFAAADADQDGTPDLWIINPRDKATKSVSVTVLSGVNFTTQLKYSGTVLPMQSTDIYSFGFVVADYNLDSHQDLWWVNRRNGALQILSGKDLTKTIFSEGTAMSAMPGADWLVLGSDRAREAIAPAAAKPKSPKEATLFSEGSFELRWKPAGLATRYTLVLTNSAGSIVASRDFNIDDICSSEWCATNISALNYPLQDDQTYTWSVTSHNANGSTMGKSRTFITDIPGAPTVIAPADGSLISDEVTLGWTRRPSADSYKIVLKNLVKTVKVKAKLGPDACIGEVCLYSVTEALPADIYTWKVVAVNTPANGKSKGGKWTFTLNGGALPPAQ